MKSATARAIFKFAEAVVFLEKVRTEQGHLVAPEAFQEAEADKVCDDALSNLKFAKNALFDALEKEDLE